MSVFLTVDVDDAHSAELDRIIDSVAGTPARIRTEVLAGYRVRVQCSGVDVDTAVALLELHRRTPAAGDSDVQARWAHDYIERHYAPPAFGTFAGAR